MAKNRQSYERLFSSQSGKPITKRRTEKAINAIWNEYDFRLSSRFQESNYSQTKNETAKNFLRREIYALGQFIDANPAKSFVPQDLINKMRAKPTTRPDVTPETFHALLMCVYEDDEKISRAERWLMAKELKYASKHKIQPELLCGFLYQSGNRNEIGKKLDDGYIEPVFRKLMDG